MNVTVTKSKTSSSDVFILQEREQIGIRSSSVMSHFGQSGHINTHSVTSIWSDRAYGRLHWSLGTPWTGLVVQGVGLVPMKVAMYEDVSTSFFSAVHQRDWGN